jgi:hypothetical protein
VISLLLSYEAERRMICSLDAEALNSPEEREKRRPLLRFARSEGRLTGHPILGLIYPSLTLAREGDPLALISAIGLDGSAVTTAEALVDRVQQRLAALLAEVPVRREASGAEDERWYWAAPLLLDLWHAPAYTRDWFGQDDLAWQWAGRNEDDSEDKETRWNDHIAQAWQLARAWVEGKQALGPQPADLPQVLAQMALAGLGVASLRALARVTGGSTAIANRQVRNSAGQVAWAFLSLFNLPESMALVRGLNHEDPYWRRVLEYCVDGGLQATLDEYAHVLKEGLGLLDSSAGEAAAEIAASMADAISLRTSTPNVDEIALNKARKRITIESRGMRGRFALRFGSERNDESGETTRADQVRSAFNSPFWPFVLATTSVGQEGLDFHPYCHAVVHWNLPSNPVDLEQREGRVHRFKGHAVRKNLARQYGLGEVCRVMGQNPDPWSALFKMASTDRGPGASDLVPFWVFTLEGGYKIERHVPALPLSRDVMRLEALRRALAVYRMVFGQSRQEDLLAFLLARFEAGEAGRIADTFRIDLAPPTG